MVAEPDGIDPDPTLEKQPGSDLTIFTISFCLSKKGNIIEILNIINT